MNVFISSVISGFEQYRDAAAVAIRALDHEPKRAGDYGASPGTPQQVCLAGIRDADVVVLILGERYGYPQDSGLSATHEEYREAQHEGKDILAFVQDGVTPELAQQAFIQEVQDWTGGQYTEIFSTADDLRTTVTRSLHRLEQSRATGQADEHEMLSRARAGITESRHVGGPTLYVAVAAGPRRQILAPATLEDERFQQRLVQEAADERYRVFNFRAGTQPRIEHDALLLDQTQAGVRVDELGTVVVRQLAQVRDENPLAGGISFMVIIDEEVETRLERAIRFAARLLDDIDGLQRLTDVVVVASILGTTHHAWRTRAEHEKSPNTGSLSLTGRPLTAVLTPPLRKRAEPRTRASELAAELTIRLRRQARS